MASETPPVFDDIVGDKVEPRPDSTDPLISDNKLSQPVINSLWFGRTRYENPWDSWRGFWHKLVPLLRWKFCNWPNQPPPQEEADQNLPVLTKEIIENEIKSNPAANQVRATWLGHASVLLQFESATVLCDPVFSDRIGPVKMPGLSYSRYRSAPINVEDLPSIDAVVISHNHYDHLDYESVKDLWDRFGEKIKWYVPKGLSSWMCSVGIPETHVTELMWWEKSELEGKGVTFTLTPAQHWCVRNGFDKNQCLWGSWAICSEKVKTWFGGDTGYCETFKEIGKEFDGFHFAAIPIGAFLPRDMMRDQHVEPKESVMIHQDLKSKKSLGIHWGTFTMGCIEHYMAPKEEMEKERELASLSEDDFVVVNHGGSVLVTADETILRTELIDDAMSSGGNKEVLP